MSEEITPRQPDRLDQLIILVQSVLTRLDSLESPIAVIEDRGLPTNQLPKILVEVEATRKDISDFKDEFVAYRLETRSALREIKRDYLKIEEWIDQTEGRRS